MKLAAAAWTIITLASWGCSRGNDGPAGANPDSNESAFPSLNDPLLADSGDIRGNGGDVVKCSNGVELFDFYEARAVRGISPHLGGKHSKLEEKVATVIRRLERLDAGRAKALKLDFTAFFDETWFTDIPLADIPDQGAVLIEPKCEVVQAAIQREPDFPHDPRYLIQKGLWSQMNADNRAGLVIHELLYRDALRHGHKNSYQVRYMTALMASRSIDELSQAEYTQIKSKWLAQDQKDQAGEIFKISDFDNRPDDQILTYEPLGNCRISHAAKLVIHADFDQINCLPRVSFTVRSPLVAESNLNDLLVHGRQGTTRKPFRHQIEYRFTADRVILLKVGAKKDLPSDELTYALPIAENRFAVPLFGIPVKYFVDQEATIQAPSAAKAEYFTVISHEVEKFSAPLKLDLFKASYFSASPDWYYTKTVIGGQDGDFPPSLGLQTEAARVKLVATQQGILGIDVNLPLAETTWNTHKSGNVVFSIPGQWVDYRTAQSGSAAMLSEIELGDGDAGARLWREREYFKPDFARTDVYAAGSAPYLILEHLEVGADYLGFLVYDPASGLTIKHSLLRSGR